MYTLRYESNSRKDTPEMRLQKAKLKAADFQGRGYHTRIRKAKEGNLVIYQVLTRVGGTG